MKEEDIKEWMMRKAMEEFDFNLSENDGVVNGIKYTRNQDLEVQIRIDYLKDEYGQEETEKEISKYKNLDGSFMEDLYSKEEVWDSILTNLKESKNI
jgi:hypothetical protein